MKNYFGNFFKTRSVGFWLYVLTALVALGGGAFYSVSYQDASLIGYYVPNAFLLTLAGVGASLVIAFVRPISKWAPLALFGCEFMSLLLFVNGTYLYLSSEFFGGVTLNGILALNPGFLYTAVAYLAVVVLSAICTFAGTEKKKK